jgi:uncharacterized protein YndB with AHSA1/START domain
MEKPNPTVDTALQIKRTFAAPREKVFRAWTDPEALKKWCAPSDEFSVPTAEVDLRVGGKYRIAMKAPDGNLYVAIGTYREILSPRKLVFTWTWEGSDMPDTLVTLDFHERGSATELVLTHEFFPNVEQRDKHQHGWTGCLNRLGKMFE